MGEFFKKYIKKEHFIVQPSTLKFRTSFKNCVYDALKNRYKETEFENEWDIYWIEKELIHEVMDHQHLLPHQKINHFRNHIELTRKDLLIKNLKKHCKALKTEGKLDELAEYNFFPQTYNLPNDYSIFFEEFKRVNQISPHTIWIMKPIGKAQGKGIFLFNKIQQISQWKSNVRYDPNSPQAEPYIVQRYISDPLLVGGKKFDMRIYVLVTSYQPLVAYLYRTGFARFTHSRYDNDDINNVYVHLTNVALQKNSENYDEKLGGKWELQNLKQYLISRYGQEKISEAFNAIQSLIIKSLLTVQKIITQDKHCFELYGYDILFDANLKPWLLEINGSPAMTANTTRDNELKVNLLDDVFTIIDLEKCLQGNEEQIGGFDLIHSKAGPSNQCLLGAVNNRNTQLKKLAKLAALRLSAEYTKTHTNNQQTGQSNQQESAQINNQLYENQRTQSKPTSTSTSNQKKVTKRPLGYQQKKPTAAHQVSVQQATAFTQNVIKNINQMAKQQTGNHQNEQTKKKVRRIKMLEVDKFNFRRSQRNGRDEEEEEEEEE